MDLQAVRQALCRARAAAKYCMIFGTTVVYCPHEESQNPRKSFDTSNSSFNEDPDTLVPTLLVREITSKFATSNFLAVMVSPRNKKRIVAATMKQLAQRHKLLLYSYCDGDADCRPTEDLGVRVAIKIFL